MTTLLLPQVTAHFLTPAAVENQSWASSLCRECISAELELWAMTNHALQEKDIPVRQRTWQKGPEANNCFSENTTTKSWPQCKGILDVSFVSRKELLTPCSVPDIP